MASRGIRDKVAIVGMGCTAFGEHWDKGVADLLIESTQAAMASAGVTRDDIDAYWLGTMGSGTSGLTLSRALRLSNKPVTRVENYCATGSEALRNACYAVASRRVRHGHGHRRREAQGLRLLGPGSDAGSVRRDRQRRSPPRQRSACSAPAYAKKYGVDEAETEGRPGPHRLEEPLQRRAQPAGPVPQGGQPGRDLAAPPDRRRRSASSTAAGCPTASAAAIVVPAEDAHRYTDKPLYVKGLSFVAGPATGNSDPDYDFTTFPEVVASAADAYAQAGVTDPRTQLAMAEVHDCFTPTELVLMEDLGFAERGFGWKEVLAGTYDLDGDLPVNPDGGLKAFGHPDRGERAAHDVRVLAAAAGRGSAGAADRNGRPGQDPWPHSQSRWPAGRMRVASSASSVPNPAHERVADTCGRAALCRGHGRRCRRRHAFHLRSIGADLAQHRRRGSDPGGESAARWLASPEGP